MHRVLPVVSICIAVLLVACAPIASDQVVPPLPATVMPPATALPPATASSSPDDAELLAVRQTVEVFGSQLHMVSLTAPDAAAQIRQYYADFISPALLDHWTSQPGAAPGSTTSSPWPDRIQIEDVRLIEPDKYGVKAFIIMVSSSELVNGGVAARVPVHIAVESLDGRWIITEFTERIIGGYVPAPLSAPTASNILTS